eukprot:CAMPEP_0194223626 /NCGR_PEP_ID=MMETSP0156-20130528/35597_1 /TAXON_ID=33649 /ORGANISM="Thalassionema nitzschioides, Strain L26-B" /LENGTH=610 /DNA_ID=CAMNT_0038954845 /DNA_START=172 /DNA_END=2004 /DNA_ORIENTATION=+
MNIIAVLLVSSFPISYSFTTTSRSKELLRPNKLVSSPAARTGDANSFVSGRNVPEANPPDESLARAIEISKIMSSQILSPLVISLLKEGLPQSWDSFWSRENGEFSNAQRVALAVEELGPTYVKFCQALASRPDVIPKSLASALEILQDDMQPFDNETAKQIIKDELRNKMNPEVLDAFLMSLGSETVGAASIGQVYKGFLPRYGDVAIKVKRRGIRELVERDAQLLKGIATWLESIPGLPIEGKKSNRLIATELVNAVEEFFSRIFEELDYRNEAANCKEFSRLYPSNGNGPSVVVPEIVDNLCTDNILVMEWLEGTKLTDVDSEDQCSVNENLSVISIGIECTISQLLETGRLHADPHGGNLLKIKRPEGNHLGYLDFGILSTVPEQVRDALVCAVAYLVFDRDVEAVASLFGELQLLSPETLEDESERAALTAELEAVLDQALVYREIEGDPSTKIPILKFDKLLDALTRLVPRFKFKLPPYFINNARALSTLEGIARSLDPSFNVFQILYPFALTKLMTNPTNSPFVEKTLQDLIRDPLSRRIDSKKVTRLLKDSALITGFQQRKVIYDILKTRGGRKFLLQLGREKVKSPYAESTSLFKSNFLRL